MWCALTLALLALLLSENARSQTPSTGALVGAVLDPTGAVLPGAVVHQINRERGTTETATSDQQGRFSFLLLRPARYQMEGNAAGSLSASAAVKVSVTETVHLDLHLQVATVFHTANVSAQPSMVDTEGSSLGKVVNETAVSGLPLVTRNFAEIASLSPGVSIGVYNAGELGLGGTALSQIAESNDGIYVHGARSYDNNFQLDGISIPTALWLVDPTCRTIQGQCCSF